MPPTVSPLPFHSVAGNDFHAGRKRALDVGDFLLEVIDNIQRVLAEAHHHDAAHGFALAVPVGHPAPDFRAEGDTPQVTHQHGHAVVSAHGDVGEVVQ